MTLPLQEKPQAFHAGSLLPDSSLTPRIQRDPMLDTITISLNRNSLPVTSHLALQVFITTPGGQTKLDQSPPVSIERIAQIPTAPIILVFNDTFPALTPAQALRGWDGSHTGPTGERHGLQHILSNAEIYGIPVVLLDLRTPQNLSAMDFIGALPQIQELVRRDLLLLPDVAFAQPDDLSMQLSRSMTTKFKLPRSRYVFAPDAQLQSDYRFQFVNLPDRSHLLRQAGHLLIPLPDLAQSNAPIQATEKVSA